MKLRLDPRNIRTDEIHMSRASFVCPLTASLQYKAKDVS